MNKPTEEQKIEVWEWCGFVFEEHNSRFEHWWTYYTPDDMKLEWHERHQRTGYPPTDLNNLFKYAVPKLVEIKKYPALSIEFYWDDAMDEVDCSISSHSFVGYAKDPALALFWAIYEVIKNGTKRTN